MKSKRSDIELRFLLLLKLDAKNLYNRISKRKHEYIEIFSLKRNRAIFKEIFEHRYAKASISDLSHCSVEIIESLDSFYAEVDEMYWYLKHTQDMPNTIEDEVQRRVNALERNYQMLSLYMDAELTGNAKTEIETFEELSPASDDIHNDSFQMQGEALVEKESEDYLQHEDFPDDDDNIEADADENEIAIEPYDDGAPQS